MISIRVHKYSLAKGLVICLLVFTNAIITACQSNQLVVTSNPQPSVILEETSVPAFEVTHVNNETTVTPSITPIILTTHLATPLPTITETKIPTITPAPDFLRRVTNLPISGVLIGTSIDGKFIASLDGAISKLSVYDFKNKEAVWELDLTSYFLRPVTIAISSDGKFVATGGINENVFVWDTDTNELIYRFC